LKGTQHLHCSSTSNAAAAAAAAPANLLPFPLLSLSRAQNLVPSRKISAGTAFPLPWLALAFPACSSGAATACRSHC